MNKSITPRGMTALNAGELPMWLFILFLSVPLIEIALFIQVGGWIGLWPTLAVVVITALIGTTLVRSQGAAALQRLRSSFNELTDPTEPLAHGAMILFSGALLLTPGFFTDAVGFLLLVPQVRSAVFREMRKRVHMHGFSTHQGPRTPREDVIDGEFTRDDAPHDDAPNGPSGWTRH